jgi:flagellar biosynthetic protein FlhF
MQVKVFEAKDMASGLKMVKDALGPDALILSTRTVRGGKFGLKGKAMMEITAAVDNNWQEPEPVSEPVRNSSRQSWRNQPPEPLEAERDITYQDLWARSEPERRTFSPSHRRETTPPGQDIHNELAELRTLVKGLSQRITGLDDSSLRTPPVEPGFAAAPANTSSIEPVTAFLAGYGVNGETAQVVARFTRDTIEKTHNLDGTSLAAILKAAITRLFTTEKLFDGPFTRQRRISLIGPTGVGKTTTLAKIAAHYLSRYGGRIGLITIDTYRIAAVEQIKVYGEIMRLPLEVVINPVNWNGPWKNSATMTWCSSTPPAAARETASTSRNWPPFSVPRCASKIICSCRRPPGNGKSKRPSAGFPSCRSAISSSARSTNATNWAYCSISIIKTTLRSPFSPMAKGFRRICSYPHRLTLQTLSSMTTGT